MGFIYINKMGLREGETLFETIIARGGKGTIAIGRMF